MRAARTVRNRDEKDSTTTESTWAKVEMDIFSCAWKCWTESELLVCEAERNAVATAQKEDHGDDQRRNDPALPHALTVRTFPGFCQSLDAPNAMLAGERRSFIEGRRLALALFRRRRERFPDAALRLRGGRD